METHTAVDGALDSNTAFFEQMHNDTFSEEGPLQNDCPSSGFSVLLAKVPSIACVDIE